MHEAMTIEQVSSCPTAFCRLAKEITKTMCAKFNGAHVVKYGKM